MNPPRASLREIFFVFLRLGATAFGGPAAHIAVMRRMLVVERGWLSDAEFAELLGAASLLPGPTSTELAIFLGQRQGRGPGLLLAGAGFILPSAVATFAFAWAYVRFGSLPASGAALRGLQPAVVGVVLAALLPLGRGVLREALPILIAIAACAAGIAGAPPLGVLVAGGALVALRGVRVQAVIALPTLAWVFLKIGAVLYGSGYLLLALARSELVTGRGWLTERQLLDAVAAGQFTPGPVSSTATFIGYLLRGPAGAAIATCAIFLPSFVLVAALGPLLHRWRTSPTVAAFLRGATAASLGLIAAVVVQLGTAALTSPLAWAIAAVTTAGAVSGRVNPSWLLVAGAAVGLALT
jgi:chromate transporter